MDLETGDVRYELDPRNEELRASGKPYVATVYVRDASGNPTSAQTNRYAADSTPSSVDLEADPFPAYTEQLRKTGYTYGAGGVLASMTDPRGNVTHYTYDASGYLTKIDSPAGAGETSRRVQTIAQNADGFPAHDVDARGQKTVYEYDGLGALTAIRYGMQDGTADFSTTYTLDANGNATAMADKEGSSSWSYDANDSVLTESRTQNGQTRTARYVYFPNGQLRTLTTLAGQDVTFTYDVLGRLTSQTDPKDGGRAITFAYDEISRPIRTTFPSGATQTFSYNILDDVERIELKRNDGTLLQRFEYGYGLDPATGLPGAGYWDGYVRAVTELDGSKVSYGYDELGRLTSAVRTGTASYDHAYAYDANDNLTSTTIDGVTTAATYDAADQLISQGSVDYSYDRNGNTLASAGTSYEYDAADETTKVTTAGGTIATFGYDGDGKRVWKGIGTARTDYWYDETGLTLETGAASATYLRELSGALLSRTEGTTTANYALDRLDNVTALLDDQSVVNTYAYAPYGSEIRTTGTYYNPFRYASTYQDTDTGLYQMGARYYDAKSGRFTQQDPLPSSIFEAERFSYTQGNPVNYSDPSGLKRGRGGKQQRLRELADDPKQPRHIRGWIRNEMRHKTHKPSSHYNQYYGSGGRYKMPLRVPKGYELAHRRGYEASRGYNYRYSDPNHIATNRNQNRIQMRMGYFRGGGGGGVCFTGDTLVITDRGRKPISRVEVGDRVLAFDQATSSVGYHKVTRVLVRSTDTTEHLSIDGEVIETTPEHPFYTEDRGWTPAGELSVGMRVRRADGGYGTIGSIRFATGTRRVYNLTVETAHTYFVGNGGWLVHNKYSIRFW